MQVKEGQQEWFNLMVEELYVFIGCIIYIGIYKEPDISIYWNSNSNKGPLYTIKNHISLTWFEQIKRYCYISDLEHNKLAGFKLPSNKKW